MVDFEPNVSTAVQRSSSVANPFGMSNLAIPNHLVTKERLQPKEMHAIKHTLFLHRKVKGQVGSHAVT